MGLGHGELSITLQYILFFSFKASQCKLTLFDIVPQTQSSTIGFTTVITRRMTGWGKTGVADR